MNHPLQVRLPGFLVDGETGLGEVIKRATAAVGVRPCGGCGRRAQALDHRVVFVGRHHAAPAATAARRAGI